MYHVIKHVEIRDTLLWPLNMFKASHYVCDVWKRDVLIEQKLHHLLAYLSEQPLRSPKGSGELFQEQM